MAVGDYDSNSNKANYQKSQQEKYACQVAQSQTATVNVLTGVVVTAGRRDAPTRGDLLVRWWCRRCRRRFDFSIDNITCHGEKEDKVTRKAD